MSDSRATPRGMFYSDDALPLGVPARTYTRKLVSDNGTTGFGPSNNQIRIPLNVSSFIDTQLSYLGFDFQLMFPDSAATRGRNCPNKDVVFEGGCWAIINRLQVLGPEGSIIEDMQYYNRLYNMLVKVQTGPQFSQTVLQAIAGAPGHSTNPVPAVSHGGDLAVPFNPRGRHNVTKQLPGINKSGDFNFTGNANGGFEYPDISELGPLAEYEFRWHSPNQYVGSVQNTCFENDKNRHNACSIESAGLEQWASWWAGLGTSNWKRNPLTNTYQAWMLPPTIPAAHSLTFNNAHHQVVASNTVDNIAGSIIAFARLGARVTPQRTFNRMAVGISGVQVQAEDKNTPETSTLINPRTLGATPAEDKPFIDPFEGGACNYNSRANPLSMPTWTGSNHSRVMEAMGAMRKGGFTPSHRTANQVPFYEYTRAYLNSLNNGDPIATQRGTQTAARRHILLREGIPLNDWPEDINNVNVSYDPNAELAYNDWFVFQHTTIRPQGPLQLTSDGTATPAPLVSYVGNDGTKSTPKVVIRWDKAKTKGCQNLAGRLLLGHAPSAILFDEDHENRGAVGSNPGRDEAHAQIIKHQFLMPLVSGLLNNSKYFPAQFISGGGCVLQVHLETNQFVPFKIIPDQPTRLEEPATSAYRFMSYRVDHPMYYAHCLNFEDAFNKRFAVAVQNGGIIYKGQSFRAHPTTFNSDTEVVSLNVEERVTSLKAIIATFVPQSYITGDHRILQVNSLSSYRLGCKAYRYRIGAVPVPDDHVPMEPFDYDKKFPGYPFPRTDLSLADSRGGLYAVDFGDHSDNTSEALSENVAQAYIEALKAFNKLTNINSVTNLLREDYERECRIASKEGYPHGFSVGSNVKRFEFEDQFSPYDCEFQGGMFLAALNTETFIQDSGVIASGINTAANALSIFLELKRTNFSANKTIQAIIYTLFDMTYSLTPQGTMVAAS